MGKLAKFIDNYQQAICRTRLGKTFNEIKRYDLPGFSRHRKGRKESRVPAAIWFSLNTGGANPDKLPDIELETLPSEQLADSGIGDGKAGMSTQGGIMEGLNDLLLQLVVTANPDAAPVTENSTDQREGRV